MQQVKLRQVSWHSDDMRCEMSAEGAAASTMAWTFSNVPLICVSRLSDEAFGRKGLAGKEVTAGIVNLQWELLQVLLVVLHSLVCSARLSSMRHNSVHHSSQHSSQHSIAGPSTAASTAAESRTRRSTAQQPAQHSEPSTAASTA